MRLLRAVLASAKARTVLTIVAGYLGWQAWLTLAAPGKVAAELRNLGPRVNVIVTLPFPPERFHVLALQRFGRVSGSEANSVEVRGVRQGDLNAIARPYWVRHVDQMKEGGNG
jgi:hypothetical protein